MLNILQVLETAFDMNLHLAYLLMFSGLAEQKTQRDYFVKTKE